MKFKLLPAIILLAGFVVPERPPVRVWLIGDSTMAKKETKSFPETGWGMPFAHFFDSTVIVDNRAKNGRSTKSFRAEGLWQPVLDRISEGDYVFIQFGHNDEGKEKTGRYTTPDEFRANLEQYCTETRSRKGIPVLVTPVARRAFDASGKVKDTHPVYADIVRSVAKERSVCLVDLEASSRALLQEWGVERSRYLFNYLDSAEHPNYPLGKKDDTHFNELGARKMAGLVLNEVRSLKLELAGRIIKPTPKK